MPLQFTPFVGILAGIVVTFIIIILTVIIVIKIKYKYTKNVSNTSDNSDPDNRHYKSFKFDSTADKEYLKAEYGASDNSSESGSPMSVLSEEEGSSPHCSSSDHDEDQYRDTKNIAVSIKSGVQLQARLSPCDSPHSWTPFLARNCEESVI